MSISKKRLRKIKSIRDSDIDYSDIPQLSETFWKKARLVLPEPKKAISLRIDREVLRWFKAQGQGYQSLMNAVLKSFVEARKTSARRE